MECVTCGEFNPEPSRFCTHCGRLMHDFRTVPFAPAAQPDETVKGVEIPAASPIRPQRLGPYQLGESLGEGGMGQVFEAVHTRQQLVVAIKMLSLLRESDPQAKERLRREGKALATLDHPNIVKFHEMGESEGRFYLVMERMHGETLAQRMQHKPMLPYEVLDLAEVLLEALAHAHEAGIIHRDLKPSNIFLAQQPQEHDPSMGTSFDKKHTIKLMDFGVVRFSKDHLLTTVGKGPQEVGTVPYMAPEQLRPEASITRQTDLYALGVLLYEALTGERLIKSSNVIQMVREVLEQSAPDLPEDLLLYLPAGFERWWRRLLQKDASMRPKDAEEALRSLRVLRAKAQRRNSPWQRTSPAWLLLAFISIAATVFLLQPELWSRFTAWRGTKAPPPTRSQPGTPPGSDVDLPEPLQTPPADLASMIKIPAGWFRFGGEGSNNPIQWKRLPTFWLDRAEISNRDYQRCVKQDMCRPALGRRFKHFRAAKQAVVGVSWVDAMNYCQFRKKRLPLPEEWEKAARGWKGRLYALRTTFPQCDSANYGHPLKGAPQCTKNPGHPSSSTRYPQDTSPFGVLAMSANVREWTQGCITFQKGQCIEREVRGGSWRSNASALLSSQRTNASPHLRALDLGFRCAWP